MSYQNPPRRIGFFRVPHKANCDLHDLVSGPFSGAVAKHLRLLWNGPEGRVRGHIPAAAEPLHATACIPTWVYTVESDLLPEVPPLHPMTPLSFGVHDLSGDGQRIADIWDPITGTFDRQVVSGPLRPRERLPSGQHLRPFLEIVPNDGRVLPLFRPCPPNAIIIPR